MKKWFMPGLITACCLIAVLMVFFSLRDKEPSGGTHEAAPSASAGEAPAAVDAEAATAIYKSNCLACHGDQLQGGMGPALTKVGADMSEADIHKQILNGGGGMPAFKGTLTDEQIATLTSWLAAKK
ncbi:c-type cytochrome [Cohnella rhizosphaerae]|uniref:Cytochrome c n=1 Tax=Cohnella rhizosphaerae TaxID=1457232 RepID=A0A9X4KRB3_9BACL|nr:cytochrome c [Cohnella rhizosphaerae]MDG0809721.1 cytochrome c [Cohnella rhizosphaerae]